MSEKQALILTFVGVTVALVATFLGLDALGAPRDLLAIAWVFFLCGGAWTVSGVVMRYGDNADAAEAP
jgi:hypothetical protein